MAGNVVVFERQMLKSPAFRTLPGNAIVILSDFMMKRQVKNGRILNNGEIEYCFSEAEAKGFPRATFNRNRDILIERGFLEIAHAGSGGKKGDKTLYALVDRWQNWGKESFKKHERPKDKRKGIGFAVYWERKNIGNENDTRISIKNET
jgi:hypothetical protein